MITEPTVFILGAGASAPYEFPTGYNLKCNICDPAFINKMREILIRTDIIPEKMKLCIIEQLETFQNTFRDSSTPSIDLFLSRHPEFADIGKMCIFIEILNSEVLSKFRSGVSDQKQDWYSLIYERMSETLFSPGGYKDFCNNNVSFITFNYDRSLEFFLYTSLMNSFVIEENECSLSSVLSKLDIIHIYGQVGLLEWQAESKDQEKVIPYGARASYNILSKYTSNILTIYNERPFAENQKAIELIKKARHVFFLGFGYAPENLKVLGIPQSLFPGQHIYGTAFNLRKGEIDRIKMLLYPHRGLNGLNVRNDFKIEDLGSKDLLREYFNYS